MSKLNKPETDSQMQRTNSSPGVRSEGWGVGGGRLGKIDKEVQTTYKVNESWKCNIQSIIQ